MSMSRNGATRRSRFNAFRLFFVSRGRSEQTGTNGAARHSGAKVSQRDLIGFGYSLICCSTFYLFVGGRACFCAGAPVFVPYYLDGVKNRAKCLEISEKGRIFAAPGKRPGVANAMLCSLIGADGRFSPGIRFFLATNEKTPRKFCCITEKPYICAAIE